jgi:long-chain acyl-CoA synthetase
VHASQDARQLVAIIVPHPQHLQNYLTSRGMDSSRELSEICEDPAVAEFVLKECNAVGTKNGFKKFELLQAVVLTPDEWTPESGLVTASNKIQPAKIAKTFKDKIDASFQSVSSNSILLTGLHRRFTSGSTEYYHFSLSAILIRFCVHILTL